MRKILLAFAFLVSLSCASLIWQTSAGSEITTKPVYFEKNIVVGSADGSVYALNPAAGSRAWTYRIGNSPLDFSIFDGELAVASTAGRISRLQKDGKPRWEIDMKQLFNASYIYAIGSNPTYLYAATSKGIYRISKGGEASLLYATEKPPTALAVGSNYLIVGAGDKLIRLDGNGNRQWEKQLESGNFWNSNPAISEATSSIYIGALDDRLHAYHLTAGYERWHVLTGGWVLTTPLIADSTVFFGSTDGKAYAASSGSGEVMWKTKLPLAVVSEPEKGVMGGVDVIFVGGTDSAAYALDMENGNVVWKGSVAGRVGSPLFYQNEVIFGSSDGTVYAYTTERACSIDSPNDGDFVGRKELVVRGQSVSEAGSQTVYVNINNLGWEEANTTQSGEWSLIIDPQGLNEGLDSISCKVVDGAGEESGSAFTTVSIVKDSNLPLDSFIVTVSPEIVEGKSFTIFVNSKEDGSPVDRFSLGIDGKTYSGDKNITITLSEPRSYQITVSKTGFNNSVLTLNVSRAGIDPLYLGIGAVVLLAAVWFVFTRFIRKPQA
ncbi:PQQ-binding-like beta-propeller repeat protein [Candidatus Micrarchaeota archaeon]|nr:PQQ-binding-like beta-propeller repeat protein [Candidatus Micrarchaeota archaeon]